MRIIVDPLLGRGDADIAQQLDGALARRDAGRAAMPNQHFDNLLADRIGRIERGHRLLEDHGEAIAAQIAQLAIGQRQQIDAVEANGAGNLRRILRQQAHNGERGDALAATGFADDAERCATCEIEFDGVDGVRYSPAVAVERDLQVGDFDKRGRGHWSPAAASVRAISCSIKLRSVMPTGSRRLGKQRRNAIQRSRLMLSSRSSSASGSA